MADSNRQRQKPNDEGRSEAKGGITPSRLYGCVMDKGRDGQRYKADRCSTERIIVGRARGMKPDKDKLLNEAGLLFRQYYDLLLAGLAGAIVHDYFIGRC